MMMSEYTQLSGSSELNVSLWDSSSSDAESDNKHRICFIFFGELFDAAAAAAPCS